MSGKPPRPKVLCIDDDLQILHLLQQRLQARDLDVICAHDGTDGIWQAVNEPPDAIITDLRMPNGDGDYLIECLKGRADTCDIPVIVLTGRRDRELERWMFTLGVEHYLPKPPNVEALAQLIHDCLSYKYSTDRCQC